MGNQHRAHAKPGKAHKQEHKGEPCHNICIEQRDVGGAYHNGLALFFHGVYAKGCQRAKQGGNQRGSQGNKYSGPESFHNGITGKQVFVPFEGKPAPLYLRLGIVEGKCD